MWLFFQALVGWRTKLVKVTRILSYIYIYAKSWPNSIDIQAFGIKQHDILYIVLDTNGRLSTKATDGLQFNKCVLCTETSS